MADPVVGPTDSKPGTKPPARDPSTFSIGEKRQEEAAAAREKRRGEWLYSLLDWMLRNKPHG